MRSSLELEKTKFKCDDAADTEVSTVKYETGGRWSLPMGEVTTVKVGTTTYYKFIQFNGDILQGKLELNEKDSVPSIIMRHLDEWFMGEYEDFQLTKIRDHEFYVRTVNRETLLTFEGGELIYYFSDLDFYCQTEAGDLEEKLEEYVADQKASGEYKPLWQNRYWVFFFSRHFDDDYQLKQLKQRLEKESNEQ